MFRRGLYSLALLAGAALAGCGSGGDDWSANRPQPFPVTGTVLYKDQPVEGATVVFYPEEKEGKAATGLTDAEGKFQLQTYSPNDGAVPGKYKVTVTKVDVASSGTSEETNVDSSAPPEQNWLIPKKYGNPATTDLEATVAAGEGNNVPLKLTD